MDDDIYSLALTILALVVGAGGKITIDTGVEASELAAYRLVVTLDKTTGQKTYEALRR